MQHPPDDLAASTVAEVVAGSWGLAVADVAYLPVGFGSHHWTVTDTAGVPWFATADPVGGSDALATLEGALSVAALATAAGIRGAHASAPRVGGGFAEPVGGAYAVSVQPWLSGAAGRFGDRWDDADALALVDLLVALHGIPVGRTAAAVEDVSVPGLPALVAVLDAVRSGRVPRVGGVGRGRGGGPGLGPLAPAVLDALRRHQPAVDRAVAAWSASEATDAGAVDLVPTHGEPHPGNVVRTPDGPVLVDWETARLAEPARDLWLVAARTGLDVAALYTERSGRVVDAGRLRARALRWALVDVAGFVPTLLTAPHETPDTAWQLEALLGTLDEL